MSKDGAGGVGGELELSPGQDDLIGGALVEEAHNGFYVDQLWAGQRRGEGEVLQQPGQEEEELVVG